MATKPKPWQQKIPARMWRNMNPHPLMVGMQKGTATSDNSSADFYKVKHSLTTNHTPSYYPNELKIYIHIKHAHECF